MAGGTRFRSRSQLSAQLDPVTHLHTLTINTPTELEGIRPPPDVLVADSSDSDAEAEANMADPSRSKSSPHSRAMSNPFPSLFTSNKKKHGASRSRELGIIPGSQSGYMQRPPPRSPPKRLPSGRNQELATGHCIACDSLMRWPTDQSVYRCAICSTINDMASSATTKTHVSETVSIRRTRQLIEQSLNSFILKRLGKNERVPETNSGEELSERSAPGYQPSYAELGYETRVFHGDSTNYVPKYAFDEPPTLESSSGQRSRALNSLGSDQHRGDSHREGKPRERQAYRDNRGSTADSENPKGIFHPLEDYIANCIRSFEVINASFPVRSDPSVDRAESDQVQRSKERRSSLLLLQDPSAKTISRSPSAGGNYRPQTSATVTLRSPQIQWDDLAAWYAVVMSAAEDWLGAYEKLSNEGCLMPTTEVDLQSLEESLLIGQEHVQRTLLKATEALLKRPGRPLTTANDVRFLFLMLENPLLYPRPPCFRGVMQPERRPPGYAHGKNGHQRDQASSSTGLLLGQHSGIIKRIFGLMSGSSAVCHNHMVSWLGRFSSSRYMRIKELASRFITYRMLRQKNEEEETAQDVDITAGLIPRMLEGRSAAYIYDEIGSSRQSRQAKKPAKKAGYMDDWQIKATARVLAMAFSANRMLIQKRTRNPENDSVDVFSSSQQSRLPPGDFYISLVDSTDLIADFHAWEEKKTRFSFSQFPFLMSIWAKTQILDHDARRQMQNKARDAVIDNIMTSKNVNPFLDLHVRRECLAADSLKLVSEVMGSGGEDIKKSLRITFRGEEGIDGGGLRKEWFLLLAREVFNPDHGLFVYDEDSRYCYFNPHSLETSDQYFLVGVVMGLAIYNSTILDVALPTFAFRKLLASAPSGGASLAAHRRPSILYTLDELAEYRPRLAQGLKHLLDFDGDVESTFSLNFTMDVERYGSTANIALVPGGQHKPVTNENRKEYVDMYVKYLLDTSVSRQFEPFKRGFFSVCGGNAFSLFSPEEVERLVRGSDEELDVPSLRAVAEYHHWQHKNPDGSEPLVGWFWETFQQASPAEQRRLLSFITGSDRVPAMGAASLSIKISCLGEDGSRFPIARTCFNQLSLWRYDSKAKLESMLWRAVHESEGFGLK